MKHPNINYYSLICSKDTNFKPTTLELFTYLNDAGVKVKSLVGKKSIFSAYSEGFKNLNADPEDIIILCHDDIEVISPKDLFFARLNQCLSLQNCGFVGVAGTRFLQDTGVWWNWNQPQFMSGGIYHGSKMQRYWTNFGQNDQVVVLDGVFLACKAKVLQDINLEAPSTFKGDWDFYDIYYTFQAHLKNYKNYTVSLLLRHESPGNPRPTWDQNRQAFVELYKDQLPAKVK